MDMLLVYRVKYYDDDTFYDTYFVTKSLLQLLVDLTREIPKVKVMEVASVTYNVFVFNKEK